MNWLCIEAGVLLYICIELFNSFLSVR